MFGSIVKGAICVVAGMVIFGCAGAYGDECTSEKFFEELKEYADNMRDPDGKLTDDCKDLIREYTKKEAAKAAKSFNLAANLIRFHEDVEKYLESI